MSAAAAIAAAGVAAVVAYASSAVVARAAARVGLVDPRPGAPVPERKRGQPPIAVSGGVTVLVAALVGALAARAFGVDLARALGPAPGWSCAALAAAFAVGIADDLVAGGLSAAPKFALQFAAACVGGVALAPRLAAAWPALAGIDVAAFALGALLALAALELANTFDHADGLCAGIGVLGLALLAPIAAGALLGWSPANLDRGVRGRAAPTAMLGDGGAHLVGMALAVVPNAWPALLVPALDLARVVALRLRAGDRPWHGDRRHLGHRLAAAGLGPRAAALACAVVALPAVAGAWSASPRLALAGAAATCVLYTALLARSRVAEAA